MSMFDEGNEAQWRRILEKQIMFYACSCVFCGELCPNKVCLDGHYYSKHRGAVGEYDDYLRELEKQAK